MLKIKKSYLTIKLITFIIINILKLKKLYSNKNTPLLDKIDFYKELTNYTVDLVKLNLLSIIFNFKPLYTKIKENFKFKK